MTSPLGHPDAVPAHAELYDISGTIQRTRLSATYRAGLAVVAVAMLLLPLIYVGLIALVGSAVWWHLTTHVGMLDGSSLQWRLLGYLTPAVIGTIVMFFMIKPLLARPAARRDSIDVSPEQEPHLFAFVREICQQVGARVPHRVQVDCQVNASAGLSQGVLSRDLVLTIGLPLAAGLTVRQLGGVLAHEFGHFAQGGGMRLTAIVRGINGWFARVVYERDRWDVLLERWSKETDARLALVLWTARGGVWISRRVLSALMWSGHAISCFMMRQMEYDADSYEVKLAGVAAFGATSMRLRELGAAHHFAYGDLRDGLSAGAVPSNLPAYVADRVGKLPAEVTSHIREVPSRKTGVFDTHPSDADRLQAAHAIGTTGVLVGGDGPATQLFSSFDSLCAAVTRHHYEHDLGLETGTLALVSTEAAITESGQREIRRRALNQLFGECLSYMRPIRLPVLPGEPLPALIAATAAARERMQALATTELAAQYREVEELERRRIDAVTALKLLESGFKAVDAASFGLTTGTREDATDVAASMLNQQRLLDARLQPFEQEAARRLSHAMAIVGALPGDSRPAPMTDDPASLVPALNATAGAVPLLVELNVLRTAAEVVDANVAEGKVPAALLRKSDARPIVKTLGDLSSALGAAPLPPGLSTDAVTIAAFCGLVAPLTPERAGVVLDKLWTLYFDLLGRVAALALEAESATASAN